MLPQRGTHEWIVELKKRRYLRHFSYIMFAWATPYFLWKQLLTWIISLKSTEAAEKFQIQTLHTILALFFYTRGVRIHGPKDGFPKPGPMIILIPQYNDYFPAVVHQIFPFPVIIPVAQFWIDFRVICWFAWKLAGNLMRRVSYTRAPLAATAAVIHQLVAQGYPVCVTAIEVPGQLAVGIDSILSMRVPIYAVRGRGFEMFELSTRFTPIDVTIEIQDVRKLGQDKKAELLAWLTA